MWRSGFLIVVSVLLVGCSSSPASTPTPAAAVGGDSPFDPLPPRITVKDAYTPVLVQVNNPPTLPVAGTDGKFHVAYNLLLQNASQVPATLRKLEVLDALPATPVKDTVIAPQQARVVFIDYTFGSPGDAPKYVLHHLYLDGAPAR